MSCISINWQWSIWKRNKAISGTTLKTTKYLKFFFVFIAQKYMFWENILVLSGIFGDIKYEKMAYRVKDNLFEFYLISGEEGDFSGSGKKKKVLQLFRQFARKAILTFSFFF